jgi:hypothetical protein
MSAKLSPAAFFSYVRKDDQYERLSRLREALSEEVRMQTGEPFEIFQDRNDVKWGQQWEARINQSLGTTTFLIAVLTPSFFKSEWCRKEAETFLRREKELGRSDLILPIYYVEIPEWTREEALKRDPLLATFAARQHIDWRDLRLEPFASTQVQRILAVMARRIRDVLQETGAPKPIVPVRAKADKDERTSAGRSEPTSKTQAASVRVEPPPLIVDQMHRGDYLTIGEAVKSASPGARIVVRPGLYRESIVIDKPLEIMGDGNTGDVTLVGSVENAIRFQANIGRVSNLTIRQEGPGKWFAVDILQGRLDLQGCDISSKSVSCVAIRGNADPRLRNNRIHSGAEAGVFVGDQASGTLEDNEICWNVLAGVHVQDDAAPTIRRNRIHSGRQGGILCAGKASAVIEDNDICANGFSAVESKEGANPTLRRNKIHDQKQNGVKIHDEGKGLFEDNDIHGNHYSGVVVHAGGDPVFLGNRINKNAQWVISVNEGGKGTFENNDLRGNAKGAWYIDESSQALVKRSGNTE